MFAGYFLVALAVKQQIEASWKTLTPAEQESTFKALEELQKKDWKELTIDEKKACECWLLLRPTASHKSIRQKLQEERRAFRSR